MTQESILGQQQQTRSIGGSSCCSFCLRRLANEFYFTCRKCNASYCYIHISRHQMRRCPGEHKRGAVTERKPALVVLLCCSAVVSSSANA